MTTTAPATISAPNASFDDDSLNAIVSRTVARIRALGAGVQSVCTEGWEVSSRPDVFRTRLWTIDVVREDGTEDELLDAEVIGAVVVTEIDRKVVKHVRGIAPVNTGFTTAHQFTIGFSDVAVAKRLGWRS